MNEQLAKIDAAFDRLEEAHFHIHAMECAYHLASPFRWTLNSFLRSLREVPQILQMQLQNEPGFVDWYRPRREELSSDPLMSFLSRQRNFVVHRGMLVPKSHGTIGITEGHGIKLGLKMPIDPLHDSDVAMDQYLRASKQAGDVLGILEDDEESLPCIEREWRMEPFDEEVLELSSRAWARIAALTRDVLGWLGTNTPTRQLDCRHSAQNIRFKLYQREDLRQRLEQLTTQDMKREDMKQGT